MKNFRLYIIRHGYTAANTEGKYISRTDLPVSSEGKAALLNCIRDYRYSDVQKVYMPPALRCNDTCDIIYPDRYRHVTPKLAEMDFGDFEGLTPDECYQKYGQAYEEWITPVTGGCYNARYDVRPPHGESFGEFTLRLAEGLSEIFKDMREQSILNAALITHGGVITNLMTGFGLPKNPPDAYMSQPGFGFEVHFSTYLWQTANAFEIVGRAPCERRV